MIELTVTIKGEDSTFRQKSLVYETVVFNENDPIIKNHVEEALNNFNQIPEDTKIRASIPHKANRNVNRLKLYILLK